MFRRALLFVLFCTAMMVAPSSEAADPARLERVERVYFWPMSNSLDQYLAEQAATEGVFSVVVDPKMAQAILTDRISSKFLDGMEELFPTPEEKAEEEKAESEKSSDSNSTLVSAYRPDTVPYHSASRAEGAVFLVDVTSREVLWSTFLKGFDASPRELHKQARAVVMRLKKQRAGSAP
jgi:hypothetical protein